MDELILEPVGRVCNYCKLWRPSEEYTKSSWEKTGGYFGCRPCKSEDNKLRHLKTRYGLTPEAYDELLISQGGKCALCDRTTAKNPYNLEGRLFVDHDHNTGKVRGLLCNSHNTAIGLLGDTPEHLQKALNYLLGAVNK